MSSAMGRVLVIDDDMPMLAMLVGALEDRGHEVVSAPNGRKGLAILEHMRPDILVTDIVMPEMDGIEVVRAVRSSRNRPKIIAMSGDDPCYLRMVALLGADATLAKPFRVEKFQSLVEEVLLSGTRAGQFGAGAQSA